MKQYENYKDSGVEWLGEIPEHWEAVKIRRLTSVKRGASPRPIDDSIYFDENGEYSWVRIRDVTASERYLEQTEVKLSELGSSKSVKLEPGNLFLSIAGSVGKPIINKVKCCIHDGFVYFPDLKLNIEFLYYIFTTGELYKGLGKLGTQLNLNTETVGGISIPLPPTNEDIECIVAFLDHKATIIEQLISEKESLITKLQEKRKALINEVVTKGLNPNAQMRDSGIEWLGMIPEHWKCFNFRYIIDILTDFTANGSFGDLAKNVTYLEEGYSRLVRLTDLRENLNNKGIYVSKKSHEYLSKSSLYGDEILLANVGAYAGLACLMPKIDYPATLGPNMFLLKFNTNVNNKFIYYTLLSSYLSEQLINKAISSAQPKLNKEDVRSCIVILPSLSDQAQIIEYIESRTTKIDQTISETQLQIQKLKEYKTAVISEVVTGKVDVREWKAST